MPASDRAKLLVHIECLIVCATIEGLLKSDSEAEDELDKEIDDLLMLQASILSCRYLHNIQCIPKANTYSRLLAELPDNEFRQATWMMKPGFAFFLNLIKDDIVDCTHTFL